MSTQVCLDCDSPGDGNCSVCHGMGKILRAAAPGTFGGLGDEVACASCAGGGHCQKCEGSGQIEVGGEG